MTLTLRRRTLIALLVFVPVASIYSYFVWYAVVNLGRQYRGGSPRCDDSWRRYLNGCTSYNTPLAWAEIIVSSAVLVAIAYGLALWTATPIRGVADAVRSFGPNSLGLRLHAQGPDDELHDLSDAVDGMLDRLAAGYEAQRRFASNASHELRTPLATQRALIEVSLADALTPEQLGLLSRQLLATNERNERLIDGLLTLAETERGLLSRDTVALAPLVEAGVALQSNAAAARDITITQSLVPVTVFGEPALLDRLVANLLENAIKYNDKGGTIAVATTADGSLTVANTGAQVPAEQVAALFEPFRRLSGERLDHGGGVGLGLTIVRSIAAAHGGSVVAVANALGGLTVTVRMRPA